MQEVGARLRRVRSQRDHWWAGQAIQILQRPFAHGRHAVAPLPEAGGCDVIASLPDATRAARGAAPTSIPKQEGRL